MINFDGRWLSSRTNEEIEIVNQGSDSYLLIYTSEDEENKEKVLIINHDSAGRSAHIPNSRRFNNNNNGLNAVIYISDNNNIVISGEEFYRVNNY